MRRRRIAASTSSAIHLTRARERAGDHVDGVRIGALDTPAVRADDRCMPFIRTIAPEEATGLLRRIYDAALRRAGKVFAVVRVQSQQPRVLEASTELYVRTMHATDEPLTRAQRELLAAYVSRINDCEY